MNTSAASAAFVPLVNRNIHCRSCGYNLKGLQRDAKCPECGHSIADSLRSDYLADRDPDYVARLQKGASLVFFLSLLNILLIAFGGFAATLVGGAAYWIVTIGGVGVTVGLLAGWWLLSTPDPGDPAESKQVGPRRVLRAAIIAQLVLLMLHAVAMAFVSGGAAPFVVILRFVGFLDLLARIAYFVSALMYIRNLSRRIPDERLEELARILLIAVPVLIGVGVLAFLFGMVVPGLTLVVLIGGALAFLVACLFLLNMLRVDLNHILAQMQPAAQSD
ncbi:MAG: hypothetical protein VYC34_05890 [Planctomycetota bacterium]|nr:hypothetical protein [Planctomycetota bacterium]